MSEHDVEPAVPVPDIEPVADTKPIPPYENGLLEKTLDSFPKHPGIDIKHTVESICQNRVKATLPVNDFWGKKTLEETLIDRNCNYDLDRAKNAVAKEFEELKIPPAMCRRVLADGYVNEVEAVQLMAQIGIMFQGRFNEGPSTQMLDYARDFAKKYGIEDENTITGLAYFEKFGHEASGKVQKIIKPNSTLSLNTEDQQFASVPAAIASLPKI
jgi:hypothetical protein